MIDNTVKVSDDFSGLDEAAYPLSVLQQRYWNLRTNDDPDDKLMHVPVAYKVTGNVSISLLTQSLNQMIKRHEALRSRFFLSRGNEPLQHPADDIDIEIDFRQLPETFSDSDVASFILNEDFGRLEFSGSTFKIILFSTEKNKHYLVFYHHHIIFDGYSRDLFLKELADHYQANLSEDLALIKPLNSSFKDYVEQERKTVNSEQGIAYKNDWERYIKSVLPDLPKNKGTSLLLSDSNHLEAVILTADELVKLKKLCQQEGLFLSHFFSAIYHIAAHLYFETPSIIAQMVMNGRTKKEYQSILGCFAKISYVKTQNPGNLTIKAFFEQYMISCQESIFKFNDYSAVSHLNNETGILTKNNLASLAFNYFNFMNKFSGKRTIKCDTGDVGMEIFHPVSLIGNTDSLAIRICCFDDHHKILASSANSFLNRKELTRFLEIYISLINYVNSENIHSTINNSLLSKIQR